MKVSDLQHVADNGMDVKRKAGVIDMGNTACAREGWEVDEITLQLLRSRRDWHRTVPELR